MPEWNDARTIDQICYDLRLADYPRANNRALIADLANGAPPYTAKEVQDNGINVNTNKLGLTSLSHSARAQFYSGILKPGRYFKATTDFGPKHKRREWASIVTSEINKRMTDSMPYFEALRAKFAMLVLHGIAPCVWQDSQKWCNRAIGVEDALVPSNTLIGFENLPFFVIYRSFTAPELIRLAKGPRPDPGWNTKLVDRCLEWVDEQATTLMAGNWPETWSPEKRAERIKEDGGYYASDRVPTIDTFDFYAYVDDGKNAGWIRRIVLDAWGTPQANGAGSYTMVRRGNMGKGLSKPTKDDFLYTSGDRHVAQNLSEVASFQFADLSAVAPFRYHSVRSLGFLLYSVCHLENRLYCKMNEAVFESLMMYFRVKSGDDVQRALKVNLINKGFIDETIQFIPGQERYQVRADLVELAIREHQRLINAHASSFSPGPEFGKETTEKTKFQFMAELQISTQLVGAGLQQAYQYQKFEYREVFRRFCIRDSKDADVRTAQANIVRRGVPLEYLVAENWEIEPERIMGNGQKPLELAIAETLMQWRPMYDPDGQRRILRDATLAITDDPSRADDLVPETPVISDSIHDAQLSVATLLNASPMNLKQGVNHQEYAATLLGALEFELTKAQSRGMSTPEQLAGMQSLAGQMIDGQPYPGNGAANHIAILEQDKNNGSLVKQLRDQLSQLMNNLKALAEQSMEAQKAQGNGQSGVDPETMGKVEALRISAEAKAANTRESAAQKQAQRQISFEQKTAQSAEQHAQKIKQKADELAIDNLKALSAATAPKTPKGKAE